MFVFISTLLCAADSGVVSTSVRHLKLQEAVYLLEGGAPHKLICLGFTVALICSQPETPHNAIN